LPDDLLSPGCAYTSSVTDILSLAALLRVEPAAAIVAVAPSAVSFDLVVGALISRGKRFGNACDIARLHAQKVAEASDGNAHHALLVLEDEAESLAFR